MKHLLLLAVVWVPMGPAHAKPAAIPCPGTTTVEMRFCASQSLQQSEKQVQNTLPRALARQWQEATRAVCARAYAPYKDGTIYPQLVVGCDDNLNRALLKEFRSLEGR
jgi:hypothetical protein